jgi:hypothetical protein
VAAASTAFESAPPAAAAVTGSTIVTSSIRSAVPGPSAPDRRAAVGVFGGLRGGQLRAHPPRVSWYRAGTWAANLASLLPPSQTGQHRTIPVVRG